MTIMLVVALDLALRGQALAAPQVPPKEQLPIKDFTNVDPVTLGVIAVQPKMDQKTGFIVGGKNPTKLIRTLPEINGRSITDVEANMRPGAKTDVGSEKGFLGKDESLLDVLAGDNRFVVDESGLTHQHVAEHLLVLAAIGGIGGDEFRYHGRRFRVRLTYFRGFQDSPFRDGTKTNAEAVVRNLDSGKEIKYSLLVPEMARQYGFYEGKGTPYRVDPREVLGVLDFLKTRKR